jgi:type IV secretion system protein VirD4
MQFDDLPRGLPGSHSDTGTAPRALWMNPQTIAEADFWTYAPDKIFLGQTEDGTSIGFKDNRHLLTVAGSRAGKGQSAILPNLALYEGSVMVIDPKGENATLSAERRGHGRGVPAGGLGQDVYVLDPFRVADVPDEYRAGFNPIADLDPDDPGFIDDCDSIADALVVASNEATANDHWNTSSRLVLRGVIAWIAAAPNIARRDLGELRRLLHLPPVDSDGNSFDDLLADMIEAPDVAHGIPADAASAIMGMASEERGSVLSTVRQNILFLSSPPMGDMLAGTGRTPSLADWKMGGVTIYLCLPATRLHRHSRFFRLFINRLLAAVESKRETPETPALMILDEMHVLGHMAALETAAGLIAGYGVRIWSIWQDFAQLKSLYNARWETFLGNASLLQAFGLNDLTTLKYVSDRLGTSSTLQISQGEITMEAAATGHTGQSRSIQASPLLSPDEVARYFSRQTGNQLVLYTGASPMFLKRQHFYDEAFKDYRGA